MKIAYLGKIQLSDVDLSYIAEARRQMDITYILEVNPRFVSGPALCVDQLYPHTGVFKAVEAYPVFSRYKDLVDLDKCYVVNTSGSMWVLKAFWANLMLLVFLLRNKFDMVHLVWPPNIYEMVLYLLRRRMVLTVHDPFPHSGLDTFIVRLRRKVAFSLVPRLIILNKAQREQFISYYRLAAWRVISSNLGSYTFLHAIRPKQTVSLNDRFILFAGKISQYKGLNYLLPAMEQLHQSHPDVRLVVAGGGKFNFDITSYQQLDYIDIRNRFIPDNELVGLIRQSLFMVCPYTDATQSGVIMSAYAFGKPCIATNVGGLPEMVKHREYGLIVKEKDTQALVDGMAWMLSNPDELSRFSQNIMRDYTSGPMSWQSIATKLKQELEGKWRS